MTLKLCKLLPALAVTLVLASYNAHASDPVDVIRVGLVRSYKRVAGMRLSSPCGLTLTDSTGSQLLNCTPDAPAELSADGGAVTIKSGMEISSGAGPYVIARSDDPAGTITIECPGQPTRRFRGRIEVWPKSGGMQLVNVLGIEDYLLGCVPEEMPQSYPIEALKAQAIAARTYALRNRGKHRIDGYDVCDSSNCQGYGGVESEKAKATEAVDTTSGVVLSYNGQLASVMYSSDCGGKTQDYSETRPKGAPPYLCSVTEPADMPHCSWEATLTREDLESKLLAGGVKEAKGLSGLVITKAGASGRVAELTVTGTVGRTIIAGAKLRTILASRGLKSLLFTVEPKDDGCYVFSGKGSGHGAGLCQAGAKWLASAPRNYTCEQILTHYFPGTQLAQIDGSSGRTSAVVGEAAKAKPGTDIRKAEAKPASIKPEKAPKGQGAGFRFEIRVKAPDGL